MRRPGGYAVLTQPGKSANEIDTFTCCHCNRIVFVKPGATPSDVGGWCTLCAKGVCPKCAGKGCQPFMKKIERIERADRLMRSL